jgi:hypothetical protein
MGSGGGRPANFCVTLARGFFDPCLHEKGKTMAVEKVGGGQTHWPAGHVARPAGYHLVSYHLGQVGEAPPCPINTPLPVKVDTHTHHSLEIPLAKFYFLV